MTAQQEARLLKLGEYPIDRSQTNVFVFFGHGHEDFFGTEMGAWMLMKKSKICIRGAVAFRPISRKSAGEGFWFMGID